MNILIVMEIEIVGVLFSFSNASVCLVRRIFSSGFPTYTVLLYVSHLLLFISDARRASCFKQSYIMYI